MLKYQKLIIVLLDLIFLYQICESRYHPRKVKYSGCFEDVPRPRAVFLTCANSIGPCEVRKGTTHILRAFFWPKLNSTNIISYAAWNNDFFPVPLPNQETEACAMLTTCPMVPGQLNAITYSITIENFWPPGEYPVIFSLTDGDTDEEILCAKFRMSLPY